MLAGGKFPPLAPELVSDVISTAADISLLVGADARIRAVMVNPHHPSFGQLSAWEGQRIEDVLTPESVAKYRARTEALEPGRGSVAVELNHSDQRNFEFPVRYVLHRIAEDRSILMLGRDLRPIAEVQQQLVAAQLAMERDYETQREMETRYRVILDASRDPMVLVSMSTGRIIDVNAAAAMLLGGVRQDLLGAAIAQEFEGRRRGEFMETMANLAVADTVTPTELTARRSQKRVLVTPKVFRAAGERLLLCQLDAAEAAQPPSDELTGNLTRLYHEGVDGIVFTDAEGTIRGANEAFLNMTDSSSLAAIRGRSLADFLARGTVDLRVLLDSVRRTGQLRLYSTRLTTDFAGQIAAELSATWLDDREQPLLVLVVRDASRADTLRRPAPQPGVIDEPVRNVMELVGNSTLKDIVAETTDVVEKMCIETALELTRNNRVAAAEMLSLSRQSLYVKLRKFGLLNKDE
ncbi:transcriptional regulator PpsR [Cereibacter sphaeroides]|uniref:transcriptional regulator PpsR n=1 Tax=Rhodobacterales TaxID=204455 RepID=UPI000BBEE85B|nr:MULTISPECIES: transcriptional regulator PpsR [Paracoccaceae]MCE6950903.1 transcriptional regulator PpsR [Cereibacter sphaeroides]MCE6960433.1 transcriptional regulator PpsR [Cereibacter sphaeroides]MCE6969383.1 transcriptional regulator PpsR [Cereibacter sphaeroides]MCE6975441.1 transcriptional regulator PpsR [Cereibacter sphaeroides]